MKEEKEKLEDIVWDEFDQTDDHIVPQPRYERGIELAYQGDSCKKPRHEVVSISYKDADHSTAKYTNQGKGEEGFEPLKRNIMLEEESWSHTPEGVFPASGVSDSNKEVTSLAPDNTRMPSHCLKSSTIDTIGAEFCADEPMIDERCAAVDSNTYPYPLGDISQTDNDFNFFDFDCEDKESNDLLYCGWQNFEEFDKLLGGCDLTFGLGGVGNENELNWFSSSSTIEGSEDMSKTDFKFSHPESSPFKNIPEQHEPSKLNNASSSVNDSNLDSACISYKSSCRSSKGGESDGNSHLTFMDGCDAISQTNDEITPKEQINFHRKQIKHHNQSERRIKDRCLENGGSFHHTGDMRFKDTKLRSDVSSHQAFTSPDIQKQKKDRGPESFGYLKTHIPYLHLNYSHPSDQTPVSSIPPGIKPKSNGLISPKESSYDSNQVRSVESSHDCPMEAPAMTLDDKREKLQCCQGFHPSFSSNTKPINLVIQTSSCDPISAPEHVHHSQNGVKNQSEAKGDSRRTLADLDSTSVQESSCMGSGLDETSLETSSFCHLQQVMEQLDMRTKLCIRDSLYRLARSAEQRHQYANLNGGSIDIRDTSGALMVEETNKCNGFMDIETDTNPIDRSIAHLLFHRPSDSSVIPAPDGLLLKSHYMIRGSINNPPVMAEKLVSQEEIVGVADTTVPDN